MNTRSTRGLAILAGGLAFVGSANAIDLIVNGSFEDVTSVGVDTTPAGWSGVCRGYNFSAVYWAGPAIPASENPGSIYTWRHRGDVSDNAFATPITQTVDLTAGASAANIDANRGHYTFSTWMASYTFNDDQPYVTMQFLDANTNQVGGTVIFDRVSSLFFTTFADGVTVFDSDAHLHAWAKYVKTSAIPPLARMAKVGIQHSPNSSFSGGPDTYVDLVKLDVSVADTRPSVESASPGGSGIPANTSLAVTLRDGFYAVNTNTLAFRFDGALATPAISKAGPVTTIQYTPPALLPSGSFHTYQISYSDTGPGAPQTNAFTFTTATYQTLPAAYAYPSASAVTRGFTLRSATPLLGTTLPTTLARAKEQLNGTLIDPFTGLPYENTAQPGPNPDGSYNIDGVLNLDNDGNAASGNFPDSEAWPGLSGGENSFSSEGSFYLELPAGYYRFGVNSDDGFEVSAGKPPQAMLGPRTVLGVFDDGRGASDTLFDFLVQSNGLYAFHMIYFEGGGLASAEFFSVDLATGQKILINNTNATAVKSYRTLTGVPLPPYVRYVQPAPNAISVPADTIIRAGIWDRSTAVVPPVQLTLNGALVSPITGKTGIVTTVSYQPPVPFAPGTTNTVKLVHGDGTTSLTNLWSFVIAGLRITTAARSGTNLVIEWIDGNPPFQVQFKNSLTNLVWTDSGPSTSNRTANVPIQPGAGLIRVVGQ